MKAADPIKKRADQIRRELAKLYPEVECPLQHNNPMQLVVATILSAQCTDDRVNMVTPALFQRYPDAAAFAKAELAELVNYIKSTGFFRNKAKNILACAKKVVEQHGGEVPSTMEELVELPGIGRKTANVVLGHVFDTPGIPVDTHVLRLSNRMGFTSNSDPVKIEFELMELIPKKEWSRFGLQMIFHGRRVCFARKPKCGDCTVAKYCPKIGVDKIAEGDE